MHRVTSCPSVFLTPKNDPLSGGNDNWIKNGRYMLFDNVNNISNLVNFDWYANPSLIEDVLHCVVNLVSYNGCYTTPCFQMLVNCFNPKVFTDEDGETFYNLDLTNKICEYSHQAIQKILQIVPLSSSTFYDVLKATLPHKRHDTTKHQIYFKQALIASQYCPSLLESILRLLINRLIQLDVDIKLEDIPEEDDEDLQFNVEIDKANEASVLAEKLDSLMEIMFDFLDAMLGITRPSSPSKANQTQPFTVVQNTTSQEQTFLILLRIFDELILTTHKSKYTQFLLFYACRLEKRTYMQRFLSYLHNKLKDVSSSPSLRMFSAAYIGSFAARARFLQPALTLETLAGLTEWAVRYVVGCGDHAAPDADLHGLFYMVAQSTFYVFCFHHSSLAKDEKFKQFADPFRKICQSRLNPFKLCLPTVVREFSRIVSSYKWFAAEDIVARNERIILATKTSFGGANQLESFFPFDPYLLRNSSKYINDIYNVWKGAREDEEDGDDSPDSDEDLSSISDGEEDDDEESVSGSVSNTSGATGMSFTSDVDQDIKFGFSLE